MMAQRAGAFQTLLSSAIKKAPGHASPAPGSAGVLAARRKAASARSASSFAASNKHFQAGDPRNCHRSGDRFAGCCLIAVLTTGLWIIWRGRFVPSLDYPMWAREGWILSEFLRGSGNALYHVKNYPVPNSVITVALAVLDLVLAPELSAKIVFSLSLGLLAFGVVYLINSLAASGRGAGAVIGLSLVLGRWVFLGSLSYLLGLGLVCIFAGSLLRRGESAANVSSLYLAAWFLALFFVHFTVLPAAVAVAGSVIVRVEGRQGIVKLLTAIAPAALLSADFALHAGAHSGRLVAVYEPALWQPWSYRILGGELLFTLAPIHALDPVTPATLIGVEAAAGLNAAWLMLVLLLAGVCLLGGLKRPELRSAAIGGILCAVLVVACGRQLASGDFGNRLVFPAVLMGLACFSVDFAPAVERPAYAALRVLGGAVILVQVLYLFGTLGKLDSVFAAEYAEMRGSSSRSEFCARYASQFTDTRFQTMAQKLRHPWLVPFTPLRRTIPQYLALEDPKFDALLPINTVGILATSNSAACWPEAKMPASDESPHSTKFTRL